MTDKTPKALPHSALLPHRFSPNFNYQEHLVNCLLRANGIAGLAENVAFMAQECHYSPNSEALGYAMQALGLEIQDAMSLIEDHWKHRESEDAEQTADLIIQAVRDKLQAKRSGGHD